MKTRHVGPSGATIGALDDRAGRPGGLFEALSPEQFDIMGKMSAEAVGDFIVAHQRVPSKEELRTIVYPIARALLEPDAPSHELQ